MKTFLDALARDPLVLAGAIVAAVLLAAFLAGGQAAAYAWMAAQNSITVAWAFALWLAGVFIWRVARLTVTWRLGEKPAPAGEIARAGAMIAIAIVVSLSFRMPV